MNPRFPIYIPSKGRSSPALHLTMKALNFMRVPYRVVIEEQEYAEYAAWFTPEQLLVLDKSFQRDYDTCDQLGDAKSKGPGPARNFIWAHAIAEGHARHWVMDDNIRCFNRLIKHMRVKVADGTCFRVMEDFTLRYTNVAMSGPQYEMFAVPNPSLPPFVTNTRIYSCNLIRNDIPFRWRGRYNEDTILSLDVLKAGWCTIQFNAFVQKKTPTQLLAGGNTKEFYAHEGTLAKSRMLAEVHPDVARVVWRYGRWHHQVNYIPFRSNKLLRRQDFELPAQPNDYGLKLVPLDGAHAPS